MLMQSQDEASSILIMELLGDAEQLWMRISLHTRFDESFFSAEL
jgi:hypothetical protein